MTGIHAAEVAIICRPYDSTAWHRSSRWEATYSIRELGFNQFRLNHSRGSSSALSPRYRHALVPSVFRLQVSRLTQRPPSESLPAARGIQACVTRRTRQDALRAPYASLACESCSDLRWIPERLWWIPEAQLDRRVSTLDPLLLLLLPHIMSLQKERLDLPFVAASRQFPIPQRPASVTAALWSAWSSYPQTTHLKVF